uniref:Uncharacterized protein n=1 Tax=Aegilops tauschii subsp. strangulata TaxID=200361 RepID=A0A453L4H4_AEGTS
GRVKSVMAAAPLLADVRCSFPSPATSPRAHFPPYHRRSESHRLNITVFSDSMFCEQLHASLTCYTR